LPLLVVLIDCGTFVAAGSEKYGMVCKTSMHVLILDNFHKRSRITELSLSTRKITRTAKNDQAQARLQGTVFFE
jgi:hypothetical protein